MPQSLTPSFHFHGCEIAAGERETVSLPVGQFLTGETTSLKVHIVHGKKPGLVMALTAAVHGDEVNGVEIIRRILASKALRSLRGTLLALPVVNTPAFAMRSRYLPDRRDLNRLFPGDESGSAGSRIARTLLEQVVARADLLIDFHTGAINRANLPQLRITREDPEARRLADAFASPVTLLAGDRDGSLRTSCRQMGKPCLLFEGGEALRLDAASIRYGVRGAQRVMRELGMLPAQRGKSHPVDTVFCKKSGWERAPSGGLFTPLIPLGRAVHVGETLGFVGDIHGSDEIPVTASRKGILIGRTNEGVVDRGDAVFHIGEFVDPNEAEEQIVEASATLSQTWQEVEDVPVPYDPVTDAV
ncbi:MAG: succinylglutamate desuccinylase/aspartoacylase family protein [Verrucomicrobiota bacterium JB023]|nr:succinylglutamate desuccinylase/aspartoacylase family protein [Verrucomicrobiota bacterium JB023]